MLSSIALGKSGSRCATGSICGRLRYLSPCDRLTATGFDEAQCADLQAVWLLGCKADIQQITQPLERSYIEKS